MNRKLYQLTNFLEDYSKNNNNYIIFIKLNTIGRSAKDVLKTLETLQISLEELWDEEFIIEEYENRLEAWERFNTLRGLSFKVDIWLYNNGVMASEVTI